MEPFIAHFQDPGGVWEVTPADKDSILGVQFNHREYGVIESSLVDTVGTV